MSKYDEYLKLKNDIKKWNDAYYKDSVSLVSDYEFDKSLERLIQMEEEHPEWIEDDSPSLNVGSSLQDSSRFPKIKHKTPMISLANSYDYDDIRRFINRIKEHGSEDIVIESKLDGLSLALIYRKGELVQAITRGNGIVGEDVLQNALQINGIPKEIYPRVDIEVRGEVLMSFKSFNDENKLREEQMLELYANPRNLASGTLRSLDPQVVKSRNLDFFAYFLMPSPFGWISQSKSLVKLSELGFNVYPGYKIMSTKDVSKIMDYIKECEDNKYNKNYPEDGLVLKVNDRRLWNSIGSNSKSPRWAVAYKFEPESCTTKLLDVVVQVGRTGKVTPVAIMDPVRISGSVVQRATLHNYDEVERLGVKIGDTVVIEKAAEIIPKIKSVVKEDRIGTEIDIEVPKVCPVCGQELIRPEYNVDLYCVNKNCPGTAYYKILHFASRECMDIRGLGMQVLSDLIDNGAVSNIVDLYRLKNKAKELEHYSTLGFKLAANLLESIEESKYRTFDRKIFALGIPEIGKSVSKKIANEVDHIFEITNSKIDKWDFLNVSAKKSLKAWMMDDNNMVMIKELEKLGVLFKSDLSKNDRRKIENNMITGKNFVITGSLNKFKNRDELVNILGLFGANVGTSVSKNTDILIAGYGTENGSKLTKAKSLGIKIWTEEEAFKILTKDIKVDIKMK